MNTDRFPKNKWSKATQKELRRIAKIVDPEERYKALVDAINEGARHLEKPYKLVPEGTGWRMVPLN